jgi:hypothetical protein
MRVPAFPIVASLVLLAAPAFAQNGAMTNSGQNGSGYNSNGMTGSPNNGMSGYSNRGTNTYNGTTGAYNQGYQANEQNQANQQNPANQNPANQQNAAGYSNAWHNGGGITSNTKDRIRQSLMQSGFRDVRVTPEAFVIHAQAPDGSHVVMLLRPDVVTGVIEQTGNSTGDSSNGASNSNNWNNGSSSANNTSNWNGGSSNSDNGANH